MKRITISELYVGLVKDEYPIIDKDEKMVYVVASPTDTKTRTGMMSRMTRRIGMSCKKHKKRVES